MNLDLNTSFISPEQLIMLGKSAAQVSETSGMSLTDAVVRSVGMTKLNSHQVRRVVEAANHEAFHRKFASMDPTMRVVELDGGPADPAAVMERLAVAAEPMKVAAYSDYRLPPQPRHKVASTYQEPMSKEAALQPVINLYSELRASHDDLIGTLGARQADVEMSVQKLAASTRQAAFDGAYHEDLETVWGEVNPKLATEVLGSLGVERAPEGVKVASRRIVDHAAVVTDFKKFAKAAAEYEIAAEAVRTLEQELVRVQTFLGSV